MDKKIIVLFLLLAVLVVPVFAIANSPDNGEDIHSDNLTKYENVYYRSSFAVPLEVWAIIFIMGFVFLMEALHFASKCACPSPDAVIISSTVSFILFLTASFIVPMLAKIQPFIFLGEYQEPKTVHVASNVAFNAIVNVGQDWLMYLCWLLAFVAFIVIMYGASQHFKIVGEAKKNAKTEEFI